VTFPPNLENGVNLVILFVTRLSPILPFIQFEPFPSKIVILNVNVLPILFPGESLLSAYDKWRGWADEKVCCDYSLHMVISYWNEKVREEMKVIASDEYGINSFKMFMAYKDVFMLRSDIPKYL
jgi:hypothetical protein